MSTAEEFGLGSSALAKGMELIGSKQPILLKQPKLLLEVARASTIMAKAAGQELPVASENLLSIMNAFEIGGKDALKTVNMLAAASKFGSAQIPALSEAIKRAAGGAKVAKVPLHDLIAAVEVLDEKSGLPATTIGIGLQNAFLKLEATSNKKIKPSVVGLTKALQNLGEMNLSATKLAKMFGIENVKTIVPLIANAKAVGAMSKKIRGTQTALEQARIRMATFNEAAKRLWTLIKNKLILIFDAMRPALMVIFKVITKVIGKMSKWAKNNPKLAKTLGVILVALGILGPVLIGIGGIITTVGTALAGVTAGMVVAAVKIGAIVAGVAALAGQMLFFTSGASEASTWSEKLTLMWEKLQEAGSALWAELGPIFMDLKSAFGDLFVIFKNDLWPILKPIMGGAIKAQIMIIAVAIKAVLLPIQMIVKALSTAIGLFKEFSVIRGQGAAIEAAEKRLEAMKKAKEAGLSADMRRRAEIAALDLDAMSEEAKQRLAQQKVAPQTAKADINQRITVAAEQGTAVKKVETDFAGDIGNVGMATTGG